MPQTTPKKLRLVYLPFLLINIGFILVCTFLHWLLFIEFELPGVKEDIILIWMPLALPWIPILIWLRPRIRLLNLKTKKRSDYPTLFMFVAWIAILIPTIIAQEYIVTATGKLTQLENINQFSKHEKTRYYNVEKYVIDKQRIGVYNTANVSGKNNEHFDMHIYIAMPLLENTMDTVERLYKYWIGHKYGKTISNRLSEDEKKERFAEFAKESELDFKTADVEHFSYLEKLGNSDEHDGFNEAIKHNKYFDNTDNEINIVFKENTEPFANRNGSKPVWLLGTFLAGALVWLGMVLIPKFDGVALRKFEQGVPEKKGDWEDFAFFFVPREGFYVTPIIISINILVFLVMVFSGLGVVSFKAKDLLAWGGNYGPLTLSGQWWRLVTNIFLHGGVMHLLTNMYGLFFVAIFLEPLLGKKKFAVCYLLTGIVASLASVWWHHATVSVGASGAIFGMFGVFLGLILMKVFTKEAARGFLVTVGIFIGFNLVAGFAGSGIDNAAHIGGLVSGFIAGILLSGPLKRAIEAREDR